MSEKPKHTVDQLISSAYDELRRIARGKLARERAGHTLDSVALVNEAYARLVAQRVVAPEERARFYGICGRLMRQVLVDHARARKAAKRDGGVQVSLSGVMLTNGAAEPILLLDLDRALTRLERAKGTEPVRLVELCAFVGFPVTEAATQLGLPRSTAQRHFDAAKGFLQLELSR